MAVDVLAHVGHLEAAGGAFDEAHAEIFLQRRDPAADPRLGDTQRPRGGGEATIGHDGNEEVEVIEVAHKIVPSVQQCVTEKLSTRYLRS